MAATKLAFFRYLLIDQMLRSKFKPFPTKDELLEACRERFGVSSASTIEKDLAAMRDEFDAPIEYSKKMRGYSYSDTNYKFLSVNLSDDEQLAMAFVESLLGEFRELPIFNEFSGAVDKVLDGMEIAKSSEIQKNVQRIIQVEQSIYKGKGTHQLKDLIYHISEKNVIKIFYQKHNEPHTKPYNIHPYLLKEYRNMWYLIGWVRKYNEVRTFGLDRIMDIEPSDETLFMTPEQAHFNPEEFYHYCIGVSALNQKPEDVILSFDPFQGKYIKSQPIHHTQEVLIEDDNEYRIKLHLIVNYELKMLILGYGSSVRVISPNPLASQIRIELENTLQQY